MFKSRDKRVFDIHRTLPQPKSKSRLDSPGLKDFEKPKKSRLKRFLVSFWLLVLALLIFIGVWDALNISRASQKMFGSSNLFSLISADSLKSQNGRTNILLVGYSIDDPGHPGATLTDSIMLLSLSSKSHAGYMLSIPRDLYVKIPGFGYGKINEAYQDSGMPLLRQIVADSFQIPIDYSVLVNYAAVRDTVNALGGITINIASPDPRGLYDTNISPVDDGPLRLFNGPQALDGQTALNLTRARGDAYGSYGFPQADFDRTQHQRQVLTAIKDKVSWTLVLNPLKNGKLFSAAGTNIKTDLTLGEARPLFGLFNSVNSANLQSLSLRSLNGKNLLSSYGTPSGQSALIPAAGLSDYSRIQESIRLLNQ